MQLGGLQELHIGQFLVRQEHHMIPQEHRRSQLEPHMSQLEHHKKLTNMEFLK